MTDLITFISDFGWGQGYVSTCELVIARLAPASRIIHLSHDVRPGDVRRAAEILQRVLPFGPVGVHLAVVDPGVGTARKALCLATDRGDYLVGPDNGLLPAAANRLGGITGAWTLAPARVRRLAQMHGDLSSTFHARDLFAPAAALLALEQPPIVLGDPADPRSLEVLEPFRARMTNGVLCAEVTEVDRFGNIELGIDFEQLRQELGIQKGDMVSVRVAGARGTRHARAVTTYADLGSGELGMIEDSWGRAALICNRLPAASVLNVCEGNSIALAPQSSTQDDPVSEAKEAE